MEKAKNSWRFFHAKEINFVNEINSLKTLARFETEGPSQMMKLCHLLKINGNWELWSSPSSTFIRPLS
jgi:hypothetical protein